MKKILLPTDFSSISKNAAMYALEMFGKEVYNGEVEFILFHAHYYIPPTATPGGLPVMTDSEVLATKKQTFKKEIADLRALFPAQTIRKELLVGEVTSTITRFVQSESIDLAVVGSYPKSGFERWVEGLNAYDISKEAGCPVLVIPDGIKYHSPKKILFATDFRNLKDSDILQPLQETVKVLEPEFMMLHIYSEKSTTFKEKEMMNWALNMYFNTEKYNYHFLEHDDPTEGIEEFVSGYDADMLALVGQDRGFFESLFHKSVTKQMIIHSRIPLFILNNAYDEEEGQAEKWKSDKESMQVQINRM